MKICRDCGFEKSLDQFGRDKNRSDGLFPYCRLCVNERARVRNAANPEPNRARATRWQQENSQRHGQISSAWKARNREICVVLCNNYRTRKVENGGEFTTEEWRILKELQDHRCMDCGRQEPEIKLTVDHIFPVSLGGSSDISNIQGLCQSCNSRKGAKV